MKCDIQHILKNKRYKIVYIKDQMYLLDTRSSFWVILIPIIFWFYPHSIYKIEDEGIKSKLKTSAVKIKENSNSNYLVVSFSVFLSMSMRSVAVPLIDKLNLSSSRVINISGVILIMLILIFFWFKKIKSYKKEMNQIIDFKNYPNERLWIRPVSIKHFLLVLSSYTFSLLFTLVGFYAFIEIGNIFSLLVATGFFFLFLIIDLQLTKDRKIKAKFVSVE